MKIQILKHSVHFFLKTIFLIGLLFFNLNQMVDASKIIIPTEIVLKEKIPEDIKKSKIITTNPKKIDIIKRNLKFLGAPERDLEILSKSIEIASNATNINHKILTALMSTESNFKKDAISSKGYKGLMQTKVASFGYSEVDTLMGAKVLEEKLRYAKGDMLKALALYKGGNNPLALRYAKNVIKVYNRLIW